MDKRKKLQILGAVSASDGDEARDPSTDPSRLEELAWSVDVKVRSGVGGNPSTPGEVLLRLADDPASWVLSSLARNPSAPGEALTRLAEDPDPGMRIGVALNPSTPVELLTRLAEEPDKDMRRCVAENPSTPVTALMRLADDSDKSVRSDVAGNPATPVEVLLRLADDSDKSVRSDVAGNPATPVQVLLRLADDSDTTVRSATARNPSTPVEVLLRLADDSERSVRRSVARNVSAPVGVLSRLANDEAHWVCKGLAENPSAPVEVLLRLADDSDTTVRSAIARNPSTPVAALMRLADDSDRWVRSGVAGNPSTPPDLSERIQAADARLRAAEDPSTDPLRLAELAKGAEEHTRRRALLNPACPNEAREASGLVFLFSIAQNNCSGTETFNLATHEIARDLVAVERFPLSTDGELFAHGILNGVLGYPNYDHDDDYQESSTLLTWAGARAPDWWADWSVIDWSNIADANPFLEEALHGPQDLFIDAMGTPGEGDDENVEGMWVRFSYSVPSGPRLWEDIESAVGSSTARVQWVADRWLAPAGGGERPELVLRFIEGALARNPASPPGVLRQMAKADDAGLRWLVTRNPGAGDEVKAMAALSLSTDEGFEQHVPNGDLKVSYDAFSLGVRARIWPVDECPFIDELPYDSRTSTNWDVDDAAQNLFDGTSSGGVVYSFTSEIVNPDDDDDDEW
jgi:hypothetical protein